MSPAEGAVSLLANPSGARITMLTPGKSYTLSVVTVSGDMESDATQYSFITQSYCKYTQRLFVYPGWATCFIHDKAWIAQG